MKLKRTASGLMAVLLALSLAACGDESSGSKESGGSTPSESKTVGGNDDAEDAAPEIEYDINGDVRLFNDFKEKYEGNYKLTGTLSTGDGDSGSPVCYAVKDNLRMNSVSVMGMTTRRYITGEGDLYVINEGTTTYQLYHGDEIGNTVYESPAYDPVFSGTGVFSGASIDGNEVTEEYAINFDGLEGTIKYTFDAKTGDIVSITTDSQDMNDTHETVTNIVMTQAQDSDFELPDLSGYVLNN